MKYNKQKDLGIKLVSTVGCHPHDAKSWKFDNDQTLNSFRKLLKSPDGKTDIYLILIFNFFSNVNKILTFNLNKYCFR